MERRIVEYKILESGELKVLERKVNDLIKAGWQPFGGLSEVSLGDECWVSQAMVKYGA